MPDHKEHKPWAVELWNACVPVGTEVLMSLHDDPSKQPSSKWRKTVRTKTRSRAWLLGGHTPVVQVNGRSGSYLLWRVQPLVCSHPCVTCEEESLNDEGDE